jgi:carbon-monoxide dehydrogenase medium subunit
MLAYGARVVATGPRGERIIPIADFFVGLFATALAPDEILTEIRIPMPTARSGGAYVKLERKVGDFAIVGVAAAVWRANGRVTARLATAGAGATPRRLRDSEKIVERDGLGDAAIEDAARRASELVEPDSDIHASADYRRHLAGVLTERALKRARERMRG